MKPKTARNKAICYLIALGMTTTEIQDAFGLDKRNTSRSLKRDRLKYILKVEDVVPQLTKYNRELDSINN